MAVTIVDYQTGAEYSAWPLTVTKPTGLAVGDVVILHAAYYSPPGTPSSYTVPGFTQVGSSLFASTIDATVWSRTIDGSEGASFTYQNDLGIANGCDVAVIGVRGTSGPAETATDFNNTTSQQFKSITVATGGLLLGFKGEFSGSAPLTVPPSNWTQLVNYGGTEYVFYRTVSAGTIAAENMSSADTVTWTAFQVMLPEAGAPPPDDNPASPLWSYRSSNLRR